MSLFRTLVPVYRTGSTVLQTLRHDDLLNLKFCSLLSILFSVGYPPDKESTQTLRELHDAGLFRFLD